MRPFACLSRPKEKDVVIGIVAVVIGRKCVILPVIFNHDELMVLVLVILDPKETCSEMKAEIFTMKHRIFGI